MGSRSWTSACSPSRRAWSAISEPWAPSSFSGPLSGREIGRRSSAAGLLPWPVLSLSTRRHGVGGCVLRRRERNSAGPQRAPTARQARGPGMRRSAPQLGRPRVRRPEPGEVNPSLLDLKPCPTNSCRPPGRRPKMSICPFAVFVFIKQGKIMFRLRLTSLPGGTASALLLLVSAVACSAPATTEDESVQSLAIAAVAPAIAKTEYRLTAGAKAASPAVLHLQRGVSDRPSVQIGVQPAAAQAADDGPTGSLTMSTTPQP
jgi:hypothetical protein